MVTAASSTTSAIIELTMMKPVVPSVAEIKFERRIIGNKPCAFVGSIPSRRIEIASARAEAEGHPRVPLPLVDPRPSGGRLRLLSPASPWLLSNSFANVEKIAARIGPATIVLHPTDAAERGLAEGDEALVANETGSLPLRVTLSAVWAAFCSALKCGLGFFLLLRGFFVGMSIRSLR